MQGFIDYFFELLFPIINAVGSITRHLIGPQVAWNMMIDNTRQPTRKDAGMLIKHRTSRQKYQFSINKFSLACFMDEAQYRIPGTIDVVRHRIFGDWNILGAGSGARCFCKI
jgi:hypothetical protein